MDSERELAEIADRIERAVWAHQGTKRTLKKVTERGKKRGLRHPIDWRPSLKPSQSTVTPAYSPADHRRSLDAALMVLPGTYSPEEWRHGLAVVVSVLTAVYRRAKGMNRKRMGKIADALGGLLEDARDDYEGIARIQVWTADHELMDEGGLLLDGIRGAETRARFIADNIPARKGPCPKCALFMALKWYYRMLYVGPVSGDNTMGNGSNVLARAPFEAFARQVWWEFIGGKPPGFRQIQDYMIGRHWVDGVKCGPEKRKPLKPARRKRTSRKEVFAL